MAQSLAVKYAEALMRRHYEAVGLLPTSRLEVYDQVGQLWLQYENDDPCGYLVFGNGWPVLKVYQCCIQVDARRRNHAAALINRLIAIGEKRNCSCISLWCADDLESNGFWRAMGFDLAGTRDNGNRRGRLHNNWLLWLDSSLIKLIGQPRRDIPNAGKVIPTLQKDRNHAA